MRLEADGARGLGRFGTDEAEKGEVRLGSGADGEAMVEGMIWRAYADALERYT